MADNFGLKIGVEGEREFKNALRDINQSFKVLGSEMKLVSSEFNKNDKSMQAVTARTEVLNRAIDTQKQKIDTLELALRNASESFGENDRRTQNWAVQLNNAKAELNGMERELKESTDATDHLGEQLRDAGDSAEKSSPKFEKLGSILKGVGVAMGAVVLAAGAAAVKLGKEVVQQFGELEQNLGGSEAVFGQYAASIQKTGEEAYKNLGTSQSKYLATANKMGALFQGSGIEQQRSLELTEKAMQRAGDIASVMGLDMQAALDSVAGAAKGNFSMMDNLGVAMNATNIEAYAVGKGLDFVWSKASQAEKAEMAMQMFFETTEQYAGNFAREATTTVSGSLGLLQAAVGSFTAGLGSADADMQNLTRNLVDAFQAVVRNVAPIIDNLTASLPAVFGAILPAVGGLLPALLTTVAELFRQVFETLLQLLPQLIPVAVGALKMIVDTLIDNLPLLIGGALMLIEALAGGLIEALPELIPATVDAVLTIVNTLIDNIDMLIEASIALILALAEGLIRSLPILMGKAPEIVQSLVDAIVRSVPKLLQAAVSILQALSQGITENLSGLGRSAAEMIETIVYGIIALLPKVVEAGANIVRGIWDGIRSMASWLASQVKGFMDGIVSGIKDSLKIRSPSQVFADIGENMALGLGEGFTDQMRDVARMMNSAVPTGELAIATGGRGGITIHQTNHFGDTYKPRDGAAAVRDLNRQLGRLYT